jgi:sterol desaturase/sphingolipid hydroxylase (fatty acid hydroxylase superfamily)
MEHMAVLLISIPVYLVGIGFEAAWLWGHPSERELGYERRDTTANIAMGAGSLVTGALFAVASAALAVALYHSRLFDLGGVWAWVVAMVGWDFLYYWTHRWEHEIRFFWAGHVNHHSSQRYNLSTALRQPWTPFLTIVTFPLLALLGVEPLIIFASGGLNLLYQFWIHTEAIDRLPRWFEAVMNTPSHHRVHHGSNRQYLDRNHGGILILWDRMFGTFEREGERVRYGLTKDIDSYNLGVIAFHEYRDIARDIAGADRWADRFGYLCRGPGWAPTAAEAPEASLETAGAA